MNGNCTVKRLSGTLVVAKDAVAANTTAFLTLDLGASTLGLAVGDVVLAVPRTDPTNLLIGPGRAKDSDEIVVPVTNPTAGALPGAEFSAIFDVYVFTATGNTIATA